MKKRLFAITCLTFISFGLASCQPIDFNDFFNSGTTTEENRVRGIEVDLSQTKTTYEIDDAFSTPYVNVLYTRTQKQRANSEYLSFSGFDSSSAGDKTISVSYDDGKDTASTSYTITVNETETPPIDPDLLVATFSTSIEATQYSNGNYGTTTQEGIRFCYYRAVNRGDELVTLLPLDKTFDYIETYGGSFGNYTAIKDIRYISITYTTQGSETIHPTLSYGEHGYSRTVPLEFAPTETVASLTTFEEPVNYFQFSSGSVEMEISKITVKYTNYTTVGGNEFELLPAYEDSFRVVPTVYDGELIPGVSSAEAYTQYIPTAVMESDKKTYTYYTYEYICEHPEYASVAALTDPIDIANYFTLFKEAPANYVFKNDYDDAKEIFGSKTRCKSTYSRTDGYASAIDDVNAASGYWELDIALNSSYSSTNRWVGRIVAWPYGINSERYGYGSQPVIHYTDDHYSTFQEYDNGGRFLRRFSVELPVVNYIWSAPINHI